MVEIPGRAPLENDMTESVAVARAPKWVNALPIFRTEGFSRSELIAYAVVSCSLFVSLAVQATSFQMDAAFDKIVLDWRMPWILEGTSHLMILILAAGVPIVLRAAPITYPRLASALLIHLIAAILFSFLHVAGMFLLREALFPAILGRPYELDLFDLSIVAYELRKDLFTYGLLLFGFWAIGAAHDRIKVGTPMQANRRIALSCGKRSVYLATDDIIVVRSVGNYIEVTSPSRTHLARMTISKLEEHLAAVGALHVRVHRSYLVNPAEIVEIKPNGVGGVSIFLKSGAEIPGSRSYRQRLDAVMAQERSNAP